MKTKILFILFFVSGFVNAQYTKLLDFAGVTNGNKPTGSLISDGTFLYGMTQLGGANNFGTIFKIMPDGTGYQKLLDFNDTANGKFPLSSLIYDGTYLYGTTFDGGVNSVGVIFKIKTNGTGFVKLLDFAGVTTGSVPFGNLLFDGTYLFGMTFSGGTNNYGTVFKIKSDGTGFSKLLDFTGSGNGMKPAGTLISDGIFLYGMTCQGGAFNSGLVFKIKPDGTGYVDLLDFSGAATGSFPWTSLIYDGTFLYGMTFGSGSNNFGTIFKIKTDGTGFSKLLDFAGAVNGADPFGSLLLEGMYLYGMTEKGGINNLGVMFKIKSDGTGYTNLFDFNATGSGNTPFGDLFSDGTFIYGLTSSGGTNNMGTLFKYQDIGMGISENNSEITFSIFPNPSSSIFNINCTEEIKMITVNDMLRKEIYKNESANKTIDASNFPQGIYFVTIKTEKGVGVKKIVKE